MNFSEIVDRAAALLQSKARVSYRALKRDFDLDEETLEDLKEELVDIRQVAADKDGKMLVWAGESQSAVTTESQPQSPVAYTPPHLAERILAEQEAMEKRGTTDGERKTIPYQRDATLEVVGDDDEPESEAEPEGDEPPKRAAG